MEDGDTHRQECAPGAGFVNVLYGRDPLTHTASSRDTPTRAAASPDVTHVGTLAPHARACGELRAGERQIELSYMETARARAATPEPKFQRYEHYYCRGCVFGMFGCRWRRYQQSTAKTGKVDCAWLVFLVLVAVYSVVWVYFWTVNIENQFADINWRLYEMTGSRVAWSDVILAIIYILVTYLLLLMFLCVVHVCQHWEVHLAVCHRVLLVLILAFFIALTVVVQQQYDDGWHLVLISLQLYGLYLHIVLVVMVTALSWLVAVRWSAVRRRGWRLTFGLLYSCLLLAIYCLPLLIDSPCVIEPERLTAKPRLVAHRGNSALAPENTLAAFEQAVSIPQVVGVETDVSLSSDGIPFLFHDDNLRRTSDVAAVLPQRRDEPVTSFNISDLKLLNAGKWFLQSDPFHTAHLATPSQRSLYNNQSVPTLAQLLDLLSQTNTSLVFDLRFHPRHFHRDQEYARIVERVLVDSVLPPKLVWWLYPVALNTSANFTDTYQSASVSPADLKAVGIHQINVGYIVPWQTLRRHLAANISVNVYTVNAGWLFSYCWCVGVTTVVTDYPQSMSDLHHPQFALSPMKHLAVWLCVDVISLVIIVVFFLFNRCRTLGQLAEAEQALVNVRRKLANDGQRKYMKEKLIAQPENTQEFYFHPVDVKDSQV